MKCNNNKCETNDTNKKHTSVDSGCETASNCDCNKSNIGLIGLAVMGRNLAQNIENNGFSVSVYNRTGTVTDEFKSDVEGKNFTCTYTLEEFVNSLSVPRKIILMVKAGKPVDMTIESLLPLLQKGDIIIDGGNSYYEDTVKRCAELKKKGIHFVGTGISGGEEGALKGPAIMPGGSKEAYELIKDVLLAVSAKAKGEPCCTYIGENGAGHFVKMVHNGIEYADMQLIAESYHILKSFLGLSAKEISAVFKDWNDGELNSYLVEITSEVLRAVDKISGQYLVDMILDKAGQKGTGMWTAECALRLGVPAPTIAEGVLARSMSAIKEERVNASSHLSHDSIFSAAMLEKLGMEDELTESQKMQFIEKVRKSLYAGKVCAYAQGFALMKTASQVYEWDLKPGEISSVFREGCIIRAEFLYKIKEAYAKNTALPNLILDDYFKTRLTEYQNDWREVIATAAFAGIPCPAFMASLSYFDGYRSEYLPANLIQGQRDYFGAHTFERIDTEGVFHHNWF